MPADQRGILNLNLQGILLVDPFITNDLLQNQIPAVAFVHAHQNIFNLNDSFLSYLDAKSIKCGYAHYGRLHGSYPPKGPLPTIFADDNNITDECDLWYTIFEAALIINPAFNIYHITDTPPILWDVLGFPGSFPNQQAPIYFSRLDVQAAIHVPNTNWTKCTNDNVFVDGVDRSPAPAFSVLPNVIEKSRRSIIVNGQHDFVIIAEGTRLSIQNMTWHGFQGFQKKPSTRLIVPGQGDLGFFHTERGLTYAEIRLCGHMVPQFQ